MKAWLCENCKRKETTEDNIICIQCGCAYPMIELLPEITEEKKRDEKDRTN